MNTTATKKGKGGKGKGGRGCIFFLAGLLAYPATSYALDNFEESVVGNVGYVNVILREPGARAGQVDVELEVECTASGSAAHVWIDHDQATELIEQLDVARSLM